MKVTWLTQAGLLFENGNITVMVDPYLSDAMAKKNPTRARRMPTNVEYLDKQPDVIIITHNHDDHLDPETLLPIIERSKKPITFLAPYNAYLDLKKFGGNHNYVMLGAHSVWSERGITFYGVHAEHHDRTAAGYILDDGEKTYYVSGDTLYNYEVIDDVTELAPDGVDYAFLPINGKGNNMNAHDAADFAYEIDAKVGVPIHWGLVDDIKPESFDFEDSLILEPFIAVEI